MNSTSSTITRSLVALVVVLLAGVLFLATPGEVSANTCTSNGVLDGLWSDHTAWSGCNNSIPTQNDVVIITSGNKVSVDISNAVANSINVLGTLTLGKNPGSPTSLTISGTGGLTINPSATVNTVSTDSHTFNRDYDT